MSSSTFEKPETKPDPKRERAEKAGNVPPDKAAKQGIKLPLATKREDLLIEAQNTEMRIAKRSAQISDLTAKVDAAKASLKNSEEEQERDRRTLEEIIRDIRTQQGRLVFDAKPEAKKDEKKAAEKVGAS